MTDFLTAQRRVPIILVEPDGTVGSTDYCLLRYSTAMPWGTRLMFGDTYCSVEWEIARHILAEGAMDYAGDGDIHVHYVINRDDYPGLGGDWIEIALDACGEVPALFLFDRHELLEFLDDTWQLCEAGSEGEFFQVPDDVIGEIHKTVGGW